MSGASTWSWPTLQGNLDQLSFNCGVARAAGQSSSDGWHQGSWRHQTMFSIANANTPGGNGSSKAAGP